VKKDRLQGIVAELVSRPGHTKVTALLHTLLTDGLGADSTLIDFERPVPEVRGRIDALLGRTVFEVKSDLTRERSDAEGQLLRYLPEREKDTGQRFTGIATDGAEFRVYIVRASKLIDIGLYRPKVDDPQGLLGWLESVVVLATEIPPDIDSVRRELGRESVAYRSALKDIEAMWAAVATSPEANLKRDLWNRLVRVAYGGNIEAPQLFFQHTYLTIVAKAIATVALFDALPRDGRALLDGEGFRDLGIVGAVEADFFDWVLMAPGGSDLVMNVARHANRFRLRDIEVDILKGLYESLIDPEQRHDLGEYYTPDWLAERICRKAIDKPLEQRVIDPACGSGTFLFHAIRCLLDAGKATKLKPEQLVSLATENIAGIDVHPIAVIIARVTYLLALMSTLHKGRPGTLTVPVYLGDALQWNAREFMNLKDLEIVVPAREETTSGKLPEEEDEKRTILRFPLSLAGEPGHFDATLDEMLSLAGRDEPAKVLAGWIAGHSIAAGADAQMLTDTYEALRALQKEGRNHIWGYVARNLSRPIWLASEAQKADVVIGNPPWLDYRAMNKLTQARFKAEMRAAGLWEGHVHGAAYDLSAYFFARSVHLYMRKSGRIAFVMPYAALTRKSYKAFRRGSFKVGGFVEAQVKFTQAWVFPSDVQPLFPVPSAVVFAERSPLPQPLPKTVKSYAGHLARRDAHADEANKALQETVEPWPTDTEGAGSPYRDKFRAGAKLDPRRLILVEKVQAGRLGANPAAPLVRGRTGNLDKKPWKDVEPPQGAVEAEFLRPVYLGESIAPYRPFEPVLAVIPWDGQEGQLLTSERAALRGHSRLAEWLSEVERLWKTHGKGKTTFAEKIDFYSLLSSQFPIKGPRIVYSKSGTNPAAAIIRDDHAIIDHKLYWAIAGSLDEAYYLSAVMNSETARSKAAKWQSQGQWGARDFDKVMFNLPIPKFDPKSDLHKRLAAAAHEAEGIASSVPLKSGAHFTRARAAIRKALYEAGVGKRIDELVAQLLG
jgi:hypothetical protein